MVKDNKTKVIWVLAVLLVLVIGYIGYAYYVNYKTQQQNQILQYGAQLGYQQAVSDLMNQVATCQSEVPVTLGNVTLNLVAVECPQIQQLLKK